MVVYIITFLITSIFLYLARRYYVSYCNYKDYYIDYRTVNNIKRYHDYYIRYVITISIAILILGTVTGLRSSDVGTDLNYTYFPNFYKILHGSMNEYTEIGFTYFNKFIQLFSSNAQTLTFVTSLIFAGSLSRISVKYSRNVFISLLAVFLSTIFFVSLNNVRQSLACIIMLEAYPFIVDNKLVKFIITVLIASIFHITALLMIPIYFVVNNKFIRKYLLTCAIVGTILIPIIAKLALILISHTKYNYFLISEFNNGESNKLNILYGFIYLVLALYCLYKERNVKKEGYVLLCMQFFNFWVSFLSLFIPVSEMISRIANYFIAYHIIMIPYIYNREYSKKGKIAILAFYTLTYGAYMIYFIVLKGYHQVLPFSWCFK